MDPATAILIGSGISAVAGLGGGLLGANSQSAALKANMAINDRNMQMQERARIQQMILAQQMLAEQKLGSTDARGNRAYFKAGVGWVVDTSPITQSLINASDRQELLGNTQDADNRRTLQNEQYKSRLREGNAANAQLEKLRTQETPDQTSLYRLLASRNIDGFNKGFDDSLRGTFKQAIRSGSPVDAKKLGEVATQRGNALSDIRGGAQTQAMGLASQLKSDATGRTSQLYNLLASRAAGVPFGAATPSTSGNAATALLAQGKSSANSGYAATVNAGGRVGGQLDYIPPDNGMANIIGQIGGIIGSGVQQYGAYMGNEQMQNKLFDLLAKRNLGNTLGTP
jgi:hypothetical protein